MLLSPLSFLPSAVPDLCGNPRKEELCRLKRRWENINTQFRLEEKRVLLKSELDGKLRSKRALELEITKRFEELKRLEAFMEKCSHLTKTEK